VAASFGGGHFCMYIKNERNYSYICLLNYARF
jgi:hypothetical protein